MPAGSTLALVGRSGSGKSTLAALIAGLLPPTTGSVLWSTTTRPSAAINHSPSNGRQRSNSQLKLDLFTTTVDASIVPQDPYIFSRTIRENITLGIEVDEQDLQRVLQQACFHTDVEQMPLGLDTPCGNAGSNLSGGQRQRIAVARSLLRKPLVLILEDGTSQLDQDTERQLTR